VQSSFVKARKRGFSFSRGSGERFLPILPDTPPQIRPPELAIPLEGRGAAPRPAEAPLAVGASTGWSGRKTRPEPAHRPPVRSCSAQAPRRSAFTHAQSSRPPYPHLDRLRSQHLAGQLNGKRRHPASRASSFRIRPKAPVRLAFQPDLAWWKPSSLEQWRSDWYHPGASHPDHVMCSDLNAESRCSILGAAEG
jgi:hypothetical protein